MHSLKMEKFNRKGILAQGMRTSKWKYI